MYNGFLSIKLMQNTYLMLHRDFISITSLKHVSREAKNRAFIVTRIRFLFFLNLHDDDLNK